jgi:hypothetical protein
MVGCFELGNELSGSIKLFFVYWLCIISASDGLNSRKKSKKAK